MFGTVISVAVTALKVAAAGVGALTVLGIVLVTIDALRKWAHKVKIKRLNARYATYIAEQLKKGNYIIIGGVYDDMGNLLEKKVWKGKLDKDLQARFKKQRGRITEPLSD